MGYNVHFIGRIGTDVETVTTGNTPFINCRVAVEDSNGKERTTRWVSVSADANRYKNMAQYLTKGKLVSITGTDRVTAYTAKNGELGVDTRVWADKIEFIPIGQKSEGNATPAPEENPKEEKNAQMTTGTVKTKKLAQKVEEPVVDNSTDDDLPF